MTRAPEEVLTFWFGELSADGKADKSHADRWWTKDESFDTDVRQRFSTTWEAAMAGQLESWRASARSRLAYVIVLDQFPRNMFRGTPQAFASDARALGAAAEGIALGHDRALAGDQRTFMYLPFMHSEQLADQERCVELFRSFRDESTGALRSALDYNLDFAEQHRAIIAKWGRFPHRNAILGRAATSEELAFLQQPNSSF